MSTPTKLVVDGDITKVVDPITTCRIVSTPETVLVKVMGGPAGPKGADGDSVEVFGPQAAPPIPHRKGDIWLYQAGTSRSAAGVMRANAEVTYLPGAQPG